MTVSFVSGALLLAGLVARHQEQLYCLDYSKLLPTSFFNTWDKTFVGHFSEGNSGKSESSHVSSWSSC